VSRASLELPVECLERDEDCAHPEDCVDAEIGPRTMRCDAVRFDLEARESAVPDRHLELGRLANDAGVRGQRLEYRFGSE